MRPIHTVPAGALIRFTYNLPDVGDNGTIEGTRGDQVGVGYGYGYEQGYLVHTRTGIRVVQEAEDVAVAGEDFPHPAQPLYLWHLTRLDETDRGEMVGCVVAAFDEKGARDLAAANARAEQTMVWYGTETVLCVDRIGTSAHATEPHLILTDVWEND